MTKVAKITAMTLAAATILAGGSALSQTPGPRVYSAPAASSNTALSAVQNYWTAERMRNARPLDIGSPISGSASERTTVSVAPLGPPGLVPGWFPSSGGAQPGMIDLGGSLNQKLADQAQTFPPFAAPGSPTDFINYAPFQRFTWSGSLTLFPVSTVGKLFFTQRGSNFVCSASVIGRSTLATAGHCVHAGNNLQSGFSTNVLFCPSFSPAGVHPVRDCWAGVSQTTSFQWFNASNFDRDYGCIVTARNGRKIANRIGNITGTTGRAFNFASRQPIFAWGYPQAAPFAGNRLITTASTEWYQLNRNTSESQLSKYIGSDQTGGSSGGPWWINFRAPSGEIAAVDSSPITDPGHPGGPFINGVNSHKRCNAAGCPAPSIFVDEMGSPQFRNSTADNNDSEDVFRICLAHANNNP